MDINHAVDDRNPISSSRTDKLQCQHCGETFTPRSSGGKQQRFCGPDCRRAFHDKPQRDNVHVGSSDLQPVIDPPPGPEPKNAPEPNSDFDWNNDEDVILREQPATAVYFNPRGALVIRQRNWPEEDAFIYISAESLDTFLDKLTDACGIPSIGKP